MSSFFAARGLRFRFDREGAEVDGPRQAVAETIEPSDAGFVEGATLAEQLGARLSALLGETVGDDEGIFDLAVEREGAIVAAVQLSCDDDEDTLGLLGERSGALAPGELASALAEALRG